ncbi:MAG: hypothetical protein QF577_08365 [Phycisphaerae bacterium]|jgi:hypothetical protein|nr:hypothetical protein [Phycisphaerae bacterium]MDP7637545.1 hypothetical protein [Phycisphaerae bacterium]
MKQFVLTPSMGKRLIGKAVACHPDVRAVLKTGTLVIVAGTTNGYVAQEVLRAVGQAQGFSTGGFRRGMVTPPGFDDASVAFEFPGDVILTDGKWRKGKQIFDVVESLRVGDVVVKGANAVNLRRKHAGVFVGDLKSGGTAGAAVPLVAGRGVKLIVPVGLEKRVPADIAALADELSAPDVEGVRMLALPGEVVTELEAVSLLTGARARLLGGGGVCGAEGAVWLGITGEAKPVRAAAQLLVSLAGEPPWDRQDDLPNAS